MFMEKIYDIVDIILYNVYHTHFYQYKNVILSLPIFI